MRFLNYCFIIFSLFVSSTLFAHTYQGKLEVVVFDYFDKNTSQIKYKLHKAGEVYELKLPDTVDKSDLLHGTQVIVEGREIKSLKEKVIQVKTISLENKKSDINKLSMTGTRNLLVLLVNFNNMRATDTVSVGIVDLILYTGHRSLLQNIRQSSFGGLNFERDTNKDGQPDIHAVNLNYDANGCDPHDWATRARQAAAQMGINISLYQHIMYVLPQNVQCSWAGIAYLGCQSPFCYSWVRAYNPNNVYSQLIYIHELGHNLGMGHSATDINNDDTNINEYGDSACFMGVGGGQYLKELNAPHRDRLHWFDNLPNNIKTIKTSGEYILHPLEAGVNGTGYLVLKIKRNASDTYYLSYRKDMGAFGIGTPNYLDRVSVHKVRAGIVSTFFIKALDNGEKFIDEKNNISVEVLDAGSDTARVYVRLEQDMPQLDNCIYSYTRKQLGCYADGGGLLRLGNPSTIYRKYIGANCIYKDKVYNIPGTSFMSDTTYVTDKNLSPLVIGCEVMLCNNSLCNDLTSTLQTINYASLKINS